MRFKSTKDYALISGLILFILGFLGFAFRSNFPGIGNGYLLAALALGFWGLVVWAGETK